jgi:hypothetical protein
MANTRILGVLTTLAVLFFAPHPLGAQTQLAKATSIKCTFSLMTVGSLREDPPKADVKAVKKTLEFEAVNADEGTARLKSEFGDYDITVRYTQGYLHFIQSFRDGPLYVTTILEQKTSSGKLKAMHSRHEYTAVALPGYTSSPEQYYGECEVL